MTRYFVKKSTLQGAIEVPPSKSHTLRAILFGSLSHGTSVIHRYLPSPDTEAMVSACRHFGATIKVFPNYIEIQGLGGHIQSTDDVIHAGNSGVVLRFCAAVGALAKHPVVITGDHSIRHQRPMKELLKGIGQLGASASSMRGDGYAPVIIQGPLQEGKAVISGEDSQPVSALLIAGAFAQGPIQLTVKNPGEKPWVALTLGWLDRLRIPYENDNFERYRLFGRAQCEGFTYHVPSDFSSAAFPLVAALVTQSDLTLHCIDMSDAQGDKEIIAVLKKMGADIHIDESNKKLYVKKGKRLTGQRIDINNFIDAITILAVVACFAEGETHLYNGAIARQKECNRIACISTELRKMGADIEETGDGLIIRPSSLKGAQVLSHHDHRMAMSLAIAGLGAEGETVITSTECVAKTFPSFVNSFQTLGALIEEHPS